MRLVRVKGTGRKLSLSCTKLECWCPDFQTNLFSILLIAPVSESLSLPGDNGLNAQKYLNISCLVRAHTLPVAKAEDSRGLRWLCDTWLPSALTIAGSHLQTFWNSAYSLERSASPQLYILLLSAWITIGRELSTTHLTRASLFVLAFALAFLEGSNEASVITDVLQVRKLRCIENLIYPGSHSKCYQPWIKPSDSPSITQYCHSYFV